MPALTDAQQASARKKLAAALIKINKVLGSFMHAIMHVQPPSNLCA
jgi:hypothetical protein